MSSQESEPWGFHDAAKAVRELLKIFDDLVKRSGKAVDAYRWYQRKKIARALDVLRFKEGGFVNVVRRIAAGRYNQSDIDEVNAILERTKPEIKASTDQLKKLTHVLREQLGMNAAIALEEIIYGDKNSKSYLRGALRRLVDTKLTTDHDHVDSAKSILRNIGALNFQIIELHELLLTETKKRSTVKPNPVRKKAK